MISMDEENEFIDFIIDKESDKEYSGDRLTSADEEMLREDKIDDQDNLEDED